MRKITAGLSISLDGVVEDPHDWHFPYFKNEMGAAVDRQLAAADTLLLGRKTYDSFAGAWPDRPVNIGPAIVAGVPTGRSAAGFRRSTRKWFIPSRGPTESRGVALRQRAAHAAFTTSAGRRVNQIASSRLGTQHSQAIPAYAVSKEKSTIPTAASTP